MHVIENKYSNDNEFTKWNPNNALKINIALMSMFKGTDVESLIASQPPPVQLRDQFRQLTQVEMTGKTEDERETNV